MVLTTIVRDLNVAFKWNNSRANLMASGGGCCGLCCMAGVLQPEGHENASAIRRSAGPAQAEYLSCFAGAGARLLAHSEAFLLDGMAGRYRECTGGGRSTAGCSRASCSTEASNEAAAV